MEIQLGNLTVKQIEERLGIEFPDDIKEFMNNTHNPDATNIKVGKWHCFEVPFELVCGDIDTATKIYNSIKHMSNDMKCKLQISVVTNQ